MDASEHTQIRQIVELITGTYAVDRIYLFGSRARGGATGESDYDLMIISDDPRLASLRPHRRIPEIFRLFFRKVRVPLDIIVRTSDEFRQRSSSSVSFDSEVQKQGLVVYAGR